MAYYLAKLDVACIPFIPELLDSTYQYLSDNYTIIETKQNIRLSISTKNQIILPKYCRGIITTEDNNNSDNCLIHWSLNYSGWSYLLEFLNEIGINFNINNNNSTAFEDLIVPTLVLIKHITTYYPNDFIQLVNSFLEENQKEYNITCILQSYFLIYQRFKEDNSKALIIFNNMLDLMNQLFYYYSKDIINFIIDRKDYFNYNNNNNQLNNISNNVNTTITYLELLSQILSYFIHDILLSECFNKKSKDINNDDYLQLKCNIKQFIYPILSTLLSDLFLNFSNEYNYNPNSFYSIISKCFKLYEVIFDFGTNLYRIEFIELLDHIRLQFYDNKINISYLKLIVRNIELVIEKKEEYILKGQYQYSLIMESNLKDSLQLLYKILVNRSHMKLKFGAEIDDIFMELFTHLNVNLNDLISNLLLVLINSSNLNIYDITTKVLIEIFTLLNEFQVEFSITTILLLNLDNLIQRIYFILTSDIINLNIQNQTYNLLFNLIIINNDLFYKLFIGDSNQTNINRDIINDEPKKYSIINSIQKIIDKLNNSMQNQQNQLNLFLRFLNNIWLNRKQYQKEIQLLLNNSDIWTFLLKVINLLQKDNNNNSLSISSYSYCYSIVTNELEYFNELSLFNNINNNSILLKLIKQLVIFEQFDKILEDILLFYKKSNTFLLLEQQFLKLNLPLNLIKVFSNNNNTFNSIYDNNKMKFMYDIQAIKNILMNQQLIEIDEVNLIINNIKIINEEYLDNYLNQNLIKNFNQFIKIIMNNNNNNKYFNSIEKLNLIKKLIEKSKLVINQTDQLNNNFNEFGFINLSLLILNLLNGLNTINNLECNDINLIFIEIFQLIQFNLIWRNQTNFKSNQEIELILLDTKNWYQCIIILSNYIKVNGKQSMNQNLLSEIFFNLVITLFSDYLKLSKIQENKLETESFNSIKGNLIEALNSLFSIAYTQGWLSNSILLLNNNQQFNSNSKLTLYNIKYQFNINNSMKEASELILITLCNDFFNYLTKNEKELRLFAYQLLNLIIKIIQYFNIPEFYTKIQFIKRFEATNIMKFQRDDLKDLEINSTNTMILCVYLTIINELYFKDLIEEKEFKLILNKCRDNLLKENYTFETNVTKLDITQIYCLDLLANGYSLLILKGQVKIEGELKNNENENENENEIILSLEYSYLCSIINSLIKWIINDNMREESQNNLLEVYLIRNYDMRLMNCSENKMKQFLLFNILLEGLRVVETHAKIYGYGYSNYQENQFKSWKFQKEEMTINYSNSNKSILNYYLLLDLIIILNKTITIQFNQNKMNLSQTQDITQFNSSQKLIYNQLSIINIVSKIIIKEYQNFIKLMKNREDYEAFILVKKMQKEMEMVNETINTTFNQLRENYQGSKEVLKLVLETLEQLK
ncbi:hypothetical protein K502DRAFT_333324 [Neoconidiobolus thromboides FSU 785]|nr:hypothetical protein K502DRAFT_333324 [Neoconidiobolus thromboides FSU 785]